MLITMFWQVSKIFRIIFPQYHLLRLLFLPPQSLQPQDHKVREKKNERLSIILFLLSYYLSVVFLLILYLTRFLMR